MAAPATAAKSQTARLSQSYVSSRLVVRVGVLHAGATSQYQPPGHPHVDGGVQVLLRTRAVSGIS